MDIELLFLCCTQTNRQHDFRLNLSYYELIHKHNPEYSGCMKLVDSMSIPSSGSLCFLPCTGIWKVDLLRCTKRYTYVLEETFLITMSEVKEYKVDWEHYGRENQEKLLTVNLEDLADRHWELEVQSRELRAQRPEGTGRPLSLHTHVAGEYNNLSLHVGQRSIVTFTFYILKKL